MFEDFGAENCVEASRSERNVRSISLNIRKPYVGEIDIHNSQGELLDVELPSFGDSVPSEVQYQAARGQARNMSEMEIVDEITSDGDCCGREWWFTFGS